MLRRQSCLKCTNGYIIIVPIYLEVTIVLATSDRCSEVTIVLGHGQILHRHSLLLFGVQLSSLPLLVVLGYSLILGLDIGPDHFLCSLYIRD